MGKKRLSARVKKDASGKKKAVRMLNEEDRIFTNLVKKDDWSLPAARERGDWRNTADLLKMGREKLVDTIRDSGLRGRGGAGFPTGTKWSFMPTRGEKPHYLVVNAGEGEPGTSKDRILMRREPHKILEGTVIAGAAVDAEVAYIYIRGEYTAEIQRMRAAVEEARAEGFVGPDCCGTGRAFEVYIHPGAGTYVCGEESALIESLEGRRGLPRLSPPFPADVGLFGCPTTVNNVETLAVVPTILRRGARWFADMGRVNNTGTRLFTISGHVEKPSVVEAELGISLRELLKAHAGGVRGGWDRLQAVIPGGASTPILPASFCDDLLMDFDSLAEVQSAFGTAAVIVMDETADPVCLIARLSRFYMHETCGQCPPCREGCGWLWRIMDRLARREGRPGDVQRLAEVADSMTGNSICGLADAAARPVQSLIRNFRPLLSACVRGGAS